MEKIKINGDFVCVDTFKSNDGRVYNTLSFQLGKKTWTFFDRNNQLQTILAENAVKKYDSCNLVCDLNWKEYYVKDSKGEYKRVEVLTPTVVNIEV